jgi:hypothetical protein
MERIKIKLDAFTPIWRNFNSLQEKVIFKNLISEQYSGRLSRLRITKGPIDLPQIPAWHQKSHVHK